MVHHLNTNLCVMMEKSHKVMLIFCPGLAVTSHGLSMEPQPVCRDTRLDRKPLRPATGTGSWRAHGLDADWTTVTMTRSSKERGPAERRVCGVDSLGLTRRV